MQKIGKMVCVMLMSQPKNDSHMQHEGMGLYRSPDPEWYNTDVCR